MSLKVRNDPDFWENQLDFFSEDNHLEDWVDSKERTKRTLETGILEFLNWAEKDFQ